LNLPYHLVRYKTNTFERLAKPSIKALMRLSSSLSRAGLVSVVAAALSSVGLALRAETEARKEKVPLLEEKIQKANTDQRRLEQLAESRRLNQIEDERREKRRNEDKKFEESAARRRIEMEQEDKRSRLSFFSRVLDQKRLEWERELVQQKEQNKLLEQSLERATYEQRLQEQQQRQIAWDKTQGRLKSEIARRREKLDFELTNLIRGNNEKFDRLTNFDLRIELQNLERLEWERKLERQKDENAMAEPRLDPAAYKLELEKQNHERIAWDQKQERQRLENLQDQQQIDSIKAAKLERESKAAKLDKPRQERIAAEKMTENQRQANLKEQRRLDNIKAEQLAAQRKQDQIDEERKAAERKGG